MSKCYESAHYAAAFLQGLKLLRVEADLCDGIIQTDDEEIFRIHRCVLAAASPYFKSMFTKGFKEANAETTVQLPFISSVGFESILSFLYSGKIVLNDETIYEVLFAANMMQLSEVLEFCTDYLLEGMSPDTCVQNYHLGEKYGLKKLEEAAENFILSNFVKLSETKDSLDLSAEELCFFLKSEKLKGSEIEIFRVAKLWLEDDPERQEFLVDVMKLILFKAIPAATLTEEVLRCESVMADPECYKMVLSALKYHTNVFKQPLDAPGMFRGEDTVVVIASYTGDEGTVQGVDMDTYLKSDLFSVTEDKILDNQPRPVQCKLEIGSLGLVCINNIVFLFGTDSESYLPVLKRFDGTAGKWFDLCAAPGPGKVGISATCAGAYIVVVGGMRISKNTNYDIMAPENLLNTALRYNIEGNSWEVVGNFPQAVAYHSSCAHNNKVYIAGGYSGPSQNKDNCSIHASQSLYTYDQKLDIWSKKADMNQARCEAVFEAVGDQLYLVGGGVLHSTRYAVPSIEVYSVVDDQWTTVVESDSETLLHAAASFVTDNIIVIVGGYNMHTKDNSGYISVFDTESKCLRKLKPMLEFSPCRHVFTVIKR